MPSVVGFFDRSDPAPAEDSRPASATRRLACAVETSGWPLAERGVAPRSGR